MYMSNCTLTASNTYIAINNAFQQGIVVLSSSRVTYSGTTTFHNNFASAVAIIESEVHFTGKLNFTENEDMDSRGKQKGGAITSTLSVLTFSGKGIFSKNRAYGYGGAICSINMYLVTAWIASSCQHGAVLFGNPAVNLFVLIILNGLDDI